MKKKNNQAIEAIACGVGLACVSYTIGVAVGERKTHKEYKKALEIVRTNLKVMFPERFEEDEES